MIDVEKTFPQISEGRRVHLARKLHRNPKQLEPAVLVLLDMTAADSSLTQQLIASLSKTMDHPPTPQEVERMGIELAKGLYYVQREFPGKLMKNISILEHLYEEKEEITCFNYNKDQDCFFIPMEEVKRFCSKIRVPDYWEFMQLDRGKMYQPDQVVFLSGVEEAYHAVQMHTPALKNKLENTLASALVPPSNFWKCDAKYAGNAFEMDAAEYRKKAATKLNCGRPYQGAEL